MHKLHGKTIAVRGWITEGAEEGEERAFVLPESLPADWHDGLDFHYAGELGFIVTFEEIEAALDISLMLVALYHQQGVCPENASAFEITVFDREGRNAEIEAENARGLSVPVFED